VRVKGDKGAGRPAMEAVVLSGLRVESWKEMVPVCPLMEEVSTEKL